MALFAGAASVPLARAAPASEGDDAHLGIHTASTVAGTAKCLAGHIWDVDTLQSDPMVAVWDPQRGERFRTLIPSDGFHNSRAIGCAASRDALYVLTEQETSPRPQSSITVVKLHRLGRDGKLLKSVTLEAGIDLWTYLLDATPEDIVSVAGGVRLTDRTSATFVTRFDADLKQTASTEIGHGAYERGATARLRGDRLLVTGQFFDDGVTRQEVPRRAASLINLKTGKYLWSTDLEQELGSRSGVQAAVDHTYGLGFVAGQAQASYVLFLDTNGRKVLERQAKPTDCTFTDGLLIRGRQMVVAGEQCGPDRSNQVLGVGSDGLTVRKRLPRAGSTLLTPDSWLNVLDDPSALDVETGRLE